VKRIITAIAPLLLAVGIAACSSATAGAPATSQPSGSLTSGAPEGTTIVAANLAFQQSSVAVDADKAISLHFVNQDQAPHNVAIFSDAGYSAPVFAGDVIQGGDTTYQVPSLRAGTYYFRCDVHPDMKGQIVAK
jgi:plastocyanin